MVRDKEKDKLEAEGFTAGPKLLAQRLDVKEKEIVELEQCLGGNDLSVDMPPHEGEESTLLRQIASRLREYLATEFADLRDITFS